MGAKCVNPLGGDHPSQKLFWRRLVDNLKLGGRMMPTIDGETSLRVRKKQKGNDSGTCQALMPKRQDFLRSGLEGTRRLSDSIVANLVTLCPFYTDTSEEFLQTR